MTIEFKRLYKEAIENEDFNKQTYDADPDNYIKPKWYSDKLLKGLYAMAYYGWLVAKGKYVKSNYYY